MAMALILINGCNNNRNQHANSSVVNTRTTNYEGTYSGTLPCADCSGIRMEITLNGGNYKILSVYEGVDENNRFEESGTYTWDQDTNMITLDGDDTNKYLFDNNTLVALDMDGNRVTGELANMYILKKR